MRRSLALLPFLILTACAAPASDEDEASVSQDELRERLTRGTFVSRFGPSGTLRDPYVEQKHVTRLTVLARNAFEAEITRERATTKTNPWMPWLTYRDIEKTTYSARGTMRFVTENGAELVDFGDDIGRFRWELRGNDLTLTATNFNNERATRLALDPNYRAPAPPAPITMTCKHRFVDRGDSIEVRLDDQQNQLGTARIARATGSGRDSEWPASGSYTMTMDESASNRQWREFEVRAQGRNRVTLRFPVGELERRSGSFDAGGSFYAGDSFLGVDYNLSLRCTHR